MSTNNPPEVVVELTRELAEHLIESADANIVFGLNALNQAPMRREAAEKLVAIMEKQKAIKAAVQKALKE